MQSGKFAKYFIGKKVTIMGLGLSGGGLGAACWLMRQGAMVTVTDLKTKPELASSIKALDKLKIKYNKVFGRHRLQDFLNANLIIKNPAVPNSSIYLKKARQAGVKIDTAIGLFISFFPGKIIGITGTKGKTTTTTLVYQILRAAGRPVILGGNIRKSPLSRLALADKKSLALLELSSFQLENFSEHNYSPQIAVWTNLAPDHLDRYNSMSDYARAKANIFINQKKKDFFITNADVPLLVRQTKKAPGQVIMFSTKKRVVDGFYIKKGRFVYDRPGHDLVFGAQQGVELSGAHNRANILAAIAVGKVLKVSPQVIRETIENFKGVKNRLQVVGEKKGVCYINDTASTIPLSSMVALKGQAGPVILIAGGSEKYLPLRDWAKVILSGSSTTAHVKKLILLNGAVSRRLIGVLKKMNKAKLKKILDPIMYNSMQLAVRAAARYAQKGDTVLLSPGAASFGLFKNEFDRGDKFIKAVKAL